MVKKVKGHHLIIIVTFVASLIHKGKGVGHHGRVCTNTYLDWSSVCYFLSGRCSTAGVHCVLGLVPTVPKCISKL